MADNENTNDKVDRKELIAQWKKDHPDVVEFMKEHAPNAAYMINDGHVSLTGFSPEEFKKWKEEKEAASKKGEEKPKAPEGNEGVEAEGQEEAPKEEITLHDNSSENQKEDEEWVKDMDNHWKEWCEAEERKYIYERNPEEKEGLAFKYYKTEQDKAADNHSVEVHYKDRNNVKIQTKDGKAADYEFWRSFADKAVKDQQTINFDKMTKEENVAKLYLACTVLGVETKNAKVEGMDFSEAFKELSAEDKKIAQEKLGLDETGKKIEKEPEQQTQTGPEQAEPAKKSFAELRGMAERPEEMSDDLKQYQERKAKARTLMGANRDISHDDTRSQEDRDIAKGRYDKIKQELINRATGKSK